MTSALRTSSGQKNRLTQSTKFLEDRDALTEESVNRISEALRSTKNLDQLVTKIISSATKSRRTAKDENSELLSPYGRTTLSGSKSFAGPITHFQHMEHLNSSDEDECTFHPKVNNKPHLCAQRVIPNNDTNEFLHNHAKDRSAKKLENQDINHSKFDRMTNTSKIGPKSVQIMFKRLQQAVKSLISDSESIENPGNLTFEGLGTVLYKIGLFQNLEFTPQENDPERSSVTINQARVKPERLSREIQFHETLWKICSLPSEDQNLISADLVFKFLLVLVEEKTEVAESATFLLESIDRALEATGKQREEGKSIYLQIKDEQNLWSLEQVVAEFRRLFDDKTSFMNIYSFTNNVVSKKEQTDRFYPHTHTPQTNKKSHKLDSRYFNETMAKKIETAHSDVRKSDLQDRKLRLYNYHKYLVHKKNISLEAKINEELAPCTFAPSITPYKKQKQRPTVAAGNESPSVAEQGNSSPKKGYFSQALEGNLGPKRQLLMYEVAHHYKEKLHQKAYALKKKEEIQELSHCTFEPRLNSNYENCTARHQDFYEGVPNGFKKAVERLHKGKEQKHSLKAELEKIPRGENYEKNRQAGFNPPSQLERPRIKRREVLVYVDVSIGHGRTGRIGIHKGDNAKALAHYFARTYSLNANMQESLEKLLQSYIDSYFAQSPQNELVEMQDARRNEYQEEAEYYDEEQEEEEEEEEEEGVEEVEEEEEEEEEDQDDEDN